MWAVDPVNIYPWWELPRYIRIFTDPEGFRVGPDGVDEPVRMEFRAPDCLHVLQGGNLKYTGIYIYYAKYYGKGGGNGQLGNKKIGVGKKNEKGERKKEENYIKKGEKGLKIL